MLASALQEAAAEEAEDAPEEEVVEDLLDVIYAVCTNKVT